MPILYNGSLEKSIFFREITKKSFEILKFGIDNVKIVCYFEFRKTEQGVRYMLAKLKLSGIGKAEECANKILAHIEAIKELQREARVQGIDIVIEVETGADSGN